MLKEFTVGKRRYGIIVGTQSSIITENDCVHFIVKNDAEITLASDFFGDATGRIKIMEIIESATPVKFHEWVHYWGIKQRVYQNYKVLARSVKEIGGN